MQYADEAALKAERKKGSIFFSPQNVEKNFEKEF